MGEFFEELKEGLEQCLEEEMAKEVKERMLVDHYEIEIKFKNGDEEKYEITKEAFDSFEDKLREGLCDYSNNQFAILHNGNGIIVFSFADVFKIKSSHSKRFEY